MWRHGAALRGIDLADEVTYDSGTYPKPITTPIDLTRMRERRLGCAKCRQCAGPLILDAP